MNRNNIMDLPFLGRYDTLEAAFVKSSVNLPLGEEDKRDMQALRKFVKVGEGRPLVIHFRRGKVVLKVDGLDKVYTAVYDKNLIAVLSSAAKYPIAEKLYMTCYVRSLPLKEMEEALSDEENYARMYSELTDEEREQLAASSRAKAEKAKADDERRRLAEASRVRFEQERLMKEDAAREEETKWKVTVFGDDMLATIEVDEDRGAVASVEGEMKVEEDSGCGGQSGLLHDNSAFTGAKVVSGEGGDEEEESLGCCARDVMVCDGFASEVETFGEAFANSVYVVASVAAGVATLQIQAGREVALSSGRLSSKGGGKLWWYVGCLAMQDDAAAVKFLKEVFPTWFKRDLDYVYVLTEFVRQTLLGEFTVQRIGAMDLFVAMSMLGKMLPYVLLHYGSVRSAGDMFSVARWLKRLYGRTVLVMMPRMWQSDYLCAVRDKTISFGCPIPLLVHMGVRIRDAVELKRLLVLDDAGLG